MHTTFAPLKLTDFPQLRLIAWNRSAGEELSEEEAFALYEANWRHVDQAALHLAERQLIERLTRVHGRGLMNV
jgi:hypothetical protein